MDTVVNDYVVNPTLLYASSPTHTPPLDNGHMPVFITGSIAHFEGGIFDPWASTYLYITWVYDPQWIAQNYIFRNTGVVFKQFQKNTNSFVSLGGLVVKFTNHGDPNNEAYQIKVNGQFLDSRIISVPSGSSVTFYYNIQNRIAPNSLVTFSIQLTTIGNSYYWTLDSWMFADPWHY